MRSGGFFPGRSSALGGIDEFPEFREISRSSRITTVNNLAAAGIQVDGDDLATVTPYITSHIRRFATENST